VDYISVVDIMGLFIYLFKMKIVHEVHKVKW